MKEQIQDKDFKIFSQKSLVTNTTDIFVLLGLLLFTQFLLGSLQGILTFILGKEAFNIFTIAQPIIFPLGFIIPIIAFYKLRMVKRHEEYNFHFTGSTWFIYPVMILMFISCMVFIEPVVDSIPQSDPTGILDFFYKLMEQIERMLQDYPISTSITIAIMAPIFEELFFRGVILKGLLNNRKTSNFWAIILSAFIFGFIHFNPWQLVGAFLLGIILGWVYYKTRSILNVMLLHFINNGLGLYLYYEYDVMGIMELVGWNEYESLAMGSIGIAVFGTLFYVLTKKYKWNSY